MAIPAARGRTLRQPVRRSVCRRELIEQWVEDQEQAARCARPGLQEDQRQDVAYQEPRTGTGQLVIPFDRKEDPSVPSGLATRIGGE
jgi:hypothetical protein